MSMNQMYNNHIGQNMPDMTIEEMESLARDSEYYCNLLAYCYENGIKVPSKNLDEAFELLYYSTYELESLWGRFRLAYYYFNGWGVKRSKKKARLLWLSIYDEINADFSKGLEVDEEKISPLTKEIYRDVTYNLGYYQMRRVGTYANIPMAIMYFDKSAKMHNRKAFNALIYIYSKKRKYKNIEKAFYYRRMLCESKSATSVDFLNVAGCYQKGIGTEIDFTKGFEYLLKAADMDNYEAIHLVSRCYADGMGVTQDIKKAERYLIKALCMNQQLPKE